MSFVIAACTFSFKVDSAENADPLINKLATVNMDSVRLVKFIGCSKVVKVKFSGMFNVLASSISIAFVWLTGYAAGIVLS